MLSSLESIKFLLESLSLYISQYHTRRCAIAFRRYASIWSSSLRESPFHQLCYQTNNFVTFLKFAIIGSSSTLFTMTDSVLFLSFKQSGWLAFVGLREPCAKFWKTLSNNLGPNRRFPLFPLQFAVCWSFVSLLFSTKQRCSWLLVMLLPGGGDVIHGCYLPTCFTTCFSDASFSAAREQPQAELRADAKVR